MKFLLTSAGLTNQHIIKALADLAGKPLTESNFVFVPTAANLESGDKVWLIENLVDFQKVGFKSVDIVDIAALPESNWKARFQSADIICFGGGNEQYLATVFDSLNMKAFLETNLEGKVYMGISAGSMVAGQFIGPELMSIVYPEEVFTEKGNPLGFVNFNFIPHLNSEWFTHVRKETLESIKPKFANKVCATDDETALKIVDDTVEIVGEGESWIS